MNTEFFRPTQSLAGEFDDHPPIIQLRHRGWSSPVERVSGKAA
jgi:hypothetical protein